MINIKPHIFDDASIARRLPNGDLSKKLADLRDAAPPPPIESLYSWLRKAYALRRRLTRDERKSLRQAGNEMNIRSGDIPLRVIIELTARKHVTEKMKLKYAARLKEALKGDVKPKRLRQFIEENGGINHVI